MCCSSLCSAVSLSKRVYVCACACVCERISFNFCLLIYVGVVYVCVFISYLALPYPILSYPVLPHLTLLCDILCHGR